MSRMKYYHLENPIKYDNEMVKDRVKCKCGHTINMRPDVDKCICTWCHNYAFRDKKSEFEFRLKEARNNAK